MGFFSLLATSTEVVTDKVGDLAKQGADAAVSEAAEVGKMFVFKEEYITMAIRLLVVAVLILVARGITVRIVDKYMRRKIRKATYVGDQQQIETVRHLITSVINYGAAILFVVGALSIFGFNMKGLVASAGIMGVAVAFIMKSMIEDWFSGVFLIFEGQFHVGDWVSLNGLVGQVLSIGMRSTVLKTDKGEKIYLSNSLIKEVINYSQYPQVLYLEVGLSYDAAAKDAIQMLEKACARVDAGELKEFITAPSAVLGIQELGDSAVVYRLMVTATNNKQYAIRRQLLQEIKLAAEEAGIDIPYPQLVVGGEIKTGKDEADAR